MFLRRQIGLYVERGVKRRRIDPVTRMSLALLSRLFKKPMRSASESSARFGASVWIG